MIIIPAIDLKGGKCVRLRQGKADHAFKHRHFDELALASAFAVKQSCQNRIDRMQTGCLIRHQGRHIARHRIAVHPGKQAGRKGEAGFCKRKV